MKYVHVHIGKCAGGAINIALHECGIDFVELHCGSANKELERFVADERSDYRYIISVRDPISRFVSAFNWDKYEKIIRKEGINNRLWVEIYDTFESADHLAQSLVCSDKRLRELSWAALTESYLHMHMGISWYVPMHVLEKIDGGEIYVVRQEKLHDDLMVLLKSLGANYNKRVVPVDKNNSTFIEETGIKSPHYLSERSRYLLGMVLSSDYAVLRRIYDMGLIPEPYNSPVSSLG